MSNSYEIALRQQTITWANVDTDLYSHLVSLDHNELTHIERQINGCYFTVLFILK